MNEHECKPVEMPVESYIESALTEWYGSRCNEHVDPACFAAWKEYDELRRNVQSADAERKQWDINYRTYCQTIADLEQRLAAAETAMRDSEARNCTSLEVIAAREQHIEAQRVEIERLLSVEAAYAASSADDANEIASLTARLAESEADARRWRYLRDNSTLAGETQEGVYLWEWEALDMNPDSIEADVDASIEAAKGGRE